jgi:hypothetical protein
MSSVLSQVQVGFAAFAKAGRVLIVDTLWRSSLHGQFQVLGATSNHLDPDIDSLECLAGRFFAISVRYGVIRLVDNVHGKSRKEYRLVFIPKDNRLSRRCGLRREKSAAAIAEGAQPI